MIEDRIAYREEGEFPSDALDRIFRKIAWQAVAENALSGVRDTNEDGAGD